MTPTSTAEESWREVRALAEAIPHLVFVTRADGEAEFYNARVSDYTGDPAPVWWQRVHPDDAPVVSERWRRSLERGEPYECELRFLGRDRAYRWFLARAQPLRDERGEILRWFGTATDIHDQKQAQVASAFLAEASEALSGSLDYEATLATVARLAVPRFADWAVVDLLTEEKEIRRVEVVHSDPAKRQVGWDLFRIDPPKLDDPSGVGKVMREGQSELHPELPPLEQQGLAPERLRVLRTLELRSVIMAPMRARGRILGVITFVLAGSERRFTPMDLATAEDLGRRAGVAIDNARLYNDSLALNRMKDEFLSTLSHELRTPMTAVLGWAQILDSGRYTPEALRKGLSVILRNARVQAQLIDDLLDMSRIITGKLRLRMEALDLNEVILAAEDTLRPTADVKGVTLRAHPSGEPLRVLGDRDRLQQVVWNLLANGIKFTPRGGSVEVTARSTAQQTLRVEVRDTGQGISAQFLPHVFERFRQEDASATRREGGLGLGLAVVRHLVELHGGSVRAHSDGPGRGATFTVELPPYAGAGASEEAAAKGPSFGPPRGGGQDLGGLRVLLVDDEQDSRDLVALILSDRGAQVIAAASAAEALSAFAHHAPHVLITDLAMPGEDGFALHRRLRELAEKAGRALPAIALTAYARAEDVQAALRAGFQRHVAKPVDAEALVSAVAELGRPARPEAP